MSYQEFVEKQKQFDAAKQLYRAKLRMGQLTIEIEAYSIIKRTPCGWWILKWDGSKRFVLQNSTKQFASIDRETAIENLIHRTKRRVGIIEAQLEQCKKFVKMVDANYVFSGTIRDVRVNGYLLED